MKKMIVTVFTIAIVFSANMIPVNATSANPSPQNQPIPEVLTEIDEEEVLITPVEDTEILGEVASDGGVLGARNDQGVLGARAPQTGDISLSLILMLGVAACAIGGVLAVVAPSKRRSVFD